MMHAYYSVVLWYILFCVQFLDNEAYIFNFLAYKFFIIFNLYAQFYLLDVTLIMIKLLLLLIGKGGMTVYSVYCYVC